MQTVLFALSTLPALFSDALTSVLLTSRAACDQACLLCWLRWRWPVGHG